MRFKAFLSDTNEDLMNAYKVVKWRPRELVTVLEVLRREYSSTRDKESYYYEKRDWLPKDSVHAAAKFIFLNKTCYNGLYRVSASGQFNVPFGGYKKPRILDQWTLLLDHKALRESRADLQSVDYIKAMEKCRLGDFVYLDPPYHPTSKTSSFTDYTPAGFSEEDQRQLSQVFSDLVERGCTVLLSNSDTPLIRKLFEGYDSARVKVNRPINCIGDRRRGFRELIVFGEPVKKFGGVRRDPMGIPLEAR